MAAERESNLRDTVDWDRNRLIDFSAGKTFSFVRSNNTGAIDVRMNGPVLDEKLSFNWLKVVNAKKASSYMFDWVLNTPLPKFCLCWMEIIISDNQSAAKAIKAQ